MSQESGVPTFRDAQTGLWSRYDPLELATPEAFARHPARVFGWYVSRWRAARAAMPHAGHYALAALESRIPSLTVVTQNVDGLHRRAGSTDVVELHGSLEVFRCSDCDRPFDPEKLLGREPSKEGEVDPPKCICGALVRPGVVWFGERLPVAALQRARDVVERCDLLLVVGTSSLVYPAAGLPELAVARGTPVVEINSDPTPLTPRATITVEARAGAALPRLVERLAPMTVS